MFIREVVQRFGLRLGEDECGWGDEKRRCSKGRGFYIRYSPKVIILSKLVNVGYAEEWSQGKKRKIKKKRLPRHLSLESGGRKSNVGDGMDIRIKLYEAVGHLIEFERGEMRDLREVQEKLVNHWTLHCRR